MRPLQLIMTAFGPYADVEKIDFRLLENRTMFVISGKTGAGKTTIFDGISFAIYGKASGEDRSGQDLRSHFANEDVETEVELTFMLRGTTYRIVRKPQQARKKKNGEGYTTIPAMAELYEIYEGQEKLLASSIRDVDELIKEIMQLDANQFRQILMIPQNEFRKLLTSDSKDKELILQRLFHTEYYQLIQNRLKDEAKRLRELVERSLQDRTLLLKSIEPRRVDKLSLLIKDETVHDKKILFLLQEEIKEESNFLKQRKAELSELHQKRDNINTTLVEAEALLDQFKEKELLEEKYKIIQSKELEMAQKEEQLQKGRKVQLLQPQEQFCLRLKDDLHLLHEQKGEKHALMNQQHKNVEMAKVELDEQIHNEDSRNEIEKKFHYLQNLKEDVYAISSTKKEVNDAIKHHQIIQNELKHQQEELDKVLTKMEEIENVIKSIDEYQRAKMGIENRIDKKRYEYRELRTMNDLLLKQNEISKLVNQRTLELDASRKQVEDKETTLKFLQERWRDSHAFQLAQSLVAGEACPVCGSTQHPLKSMAKKEMVNQEDLKQAELEVQEFQKITLEAEREFTKTSTLYDSICEQVKDREEVLAGIIDQYSLIDTEILLESAVSAGKELAEKLKEINLFLEKNSLVNQKQAELSTKQSELTNSIRELAENERRSYEKLSSVQAKLENLEKKIPESLRNEKEYESEVTKVTVKKDKLFQMLEQAKINYQDSINAYKQVEIHYHSIIENIDKQTKAYHHELEKWEKAKVAQGFITDEEYYQSVKIIDQLQNLELDITTYREDKRSVEDRLQDSIKRLNKVEYPHIDKLRESKVDCIKKIEIKESEVFSSQSNLTHHQQLLAKVTMINEEVKELETQFSLIGHLASIARGENVHRLTFERFVLASFLEDILVVANQKLTKMTSGRYLLMRKKERSKGNVQSGLELLVFDQYTSHERHVKTLSGGESFKASLALALGLAEVVQQYAGGVSLETMFIDEGFGTLDPESLDHAIEALLDVQSTGRLVGIISHVPELKERIDAQLVVNSSQTGSSTTFQFIN